MQRRTALKGMLLFSIGGTTIYSCSDPFEAIKALDIPKLPLVDNEIAILSDLSERIVPLQSIPALQNHSSLPYILQMVNDCFSEEDRVKFIKGYQNFDAAIQSNLGKSYLKTTDEEKNALIQQLNSAEEQMNEDTKNTFSIIKSLALNYLTNTQYILEQVRYYELAPGRFNGCLPLSELKNRNKKLENHGG